jgi:hypothetical protein
MKPLLYFYVLIILLVSTSCAEQEISYLDGKLVKDNKDCVFLVKAQMGTLANLQFIADASGDSCPLKKKEVK